MNSILISVLLIVIGLSVGIGISFIINLLRGNMASKKAEGIISQARKDADKLKRDSILEQKEEAQTEEPKVEEVTQPELISQKGKRRST